MKKTRFASYLLTGKAATLPFMINNSLADVVPSYTEILSPNLTLIEQPATGVKLMATTASASGGSYGGAGAYAADAQVCNSPLPGVMNVVITGVKPGETVYLLASSDKDGGVYTSYSSKIRIGTSNTTIISAFKFAGQDFGNEAAGVDQMTSSVSVPVDLNKLQQKNLFANGKFYIQAGIFPTLDPLSIWQHARFSELDTITVSSAGCSSSYGSPSPYGGGTY